jgi:hypothetical protein
MLADLLERLLEGVNAFLSRPLHLRDCKLPKANEMAKPYKGVPTSPASYTANKSSPGYRRTTNLPQAMADCCGRLQAAAAGAGHGWLGRRGAFFKRN